jgi:murein DD-endopeptidase MepM/ murein hydrolase activator NlpD
MSRVHASLERRFPERRLFVRSEDHTRFIRLRPATQLAAWVGGTALVIWTLGATAVILMDSIGAGNFRAQAQRDKLFYEERLNALSGERDQRASEAMAAQDRFNAALAQVSAMQSELLAMDEERRELQLGLDSVRSAMARAVDDRDAARRSLALATAESATGDADALADTVDLLARTLEETAAERDTVAADAAQAVQIAGDLDLELRLLEERNDEIFGQLEDALSISVEPLDGLFREAGLDPQDIIDDVRRGYSGLGGPLTPLSISTMGATSAADPTARANRIIDSLDQLNMYRIAIERVPFAMPVQAAFRYTSGFGGRWGRMHEGIDMAAPIGTPVYATAEGVVIYAGWQNGYGRLIKIQHEFGIETRYGHLNAIDVQVGQRVSRGDHIGDMGNSGRSTGPHLHYEVRIGGEAINPMIYIGAGNDVL